MKIKVIPWFDSGTEDGVLSLAKRPFVIEDNGDRHPIKEIIRTTIQPNDYESLDIFLDNVDSVHNDSIRNIILNIWEFNNENN